MCVRSLFQSPRIPYSRDSCSYKFLLGPDVFGFRSLSFRVENLGFASLLGLLRVVLSRHQKNKDHRARAPRSLLVANRWPIRRTTTEITDSADVSGLDISGNQAMSDVCGHRRTTYLET